MTPSEQCHRAGLKSLTRLSEVSGQSVQTLINWHRNKPKLFELVLLGAVTSTKCKKCGGEMKEGKAIAQTFTGVPDFIGSKECVTISPGGSIKLIDCLKCEKCGYSTTKGESNE